MSEPATDPSSTDTRANPAPAAPETGHPGQGGANAITARLRDVCDEAGPWARITSTLFQREFLGYFRTPIAYVFLCAMVLLLNGILWSRVGGFFERETADLDEFFFWMHVIFLLLMPAVGMRLWAEERRSGTWELLFTYPITVTQAVVAKFLAAWAFVTIAIALTFTMPVTIGILGEPDWGPVISGYIGAILLAGGYLSLCSLGSALTRNQVIGFVIGLGLCAVMFLIGFDVWKAILTGLGLPVTVVDGLANFGFIPHFEPLTRGLVRIGDVLHFLAFATAMLSLNVLALQRN